MTISFNLQPCRRKPCIITLSLLISLYFLISLHKIFRSSPSHLDMWILFPVCPDPALML